MSRWLPRHIMLAVAALLLAAIVVVPSLRVGVSHAIAQETPDPTEPPVPRNIDVVGQVGGAIGAVAVRDGYAYIGQGQRLAVLDLSNPRHPRLVGSTGGHGDHVTQIVLAGEYAYVAVEGHFQVADAGVRIVHIADPTSPVEVGFFRSPDYWVTVVAMVGTYGYVGDSRDSRNSILVDFSDPANPRELGPSTVSPVKLAIMGHYGYALGSKEIGVFDLSDPAHPSQVDALARSSSVESYALDGTLLYLLSDTYVLDIMDLADPVHPRAVSQADFRRAQPWYIAVSDGRAWMANRRDGLTVVDVSDPTRLTILGATSADIGMPRVVTGGYAYATGADRGLQVLALVDGAAPSEIGQFQSPGHGTGMVGVALAGPYAYVADVANGLWAYRVDDPAHPVVVGHYQEEDVSAERVAASGRYVYLLQRAIGRLEDALVVLDVEDPTLPKRIAAVDLPDLRGNDLVLAGSYVYIATSASLRVVDISDPADPREVGSFTLPLEESTEYGPVTDRLSCIAVDGHFVYMASMTEKRHYGTNTPYPITAGSGLSVIDVSDPENPVEVSHLPDAWDPGAVGVVGSYVYVLANEEGVPARDGIHIFDISNPASPTETGVLPNIGGGFSQTIVQVGRYVYVAAGTLHVFDAADPAQPVEVGSTGPISVNGLVVDNGLAYVGAGDEGLMILRFTGGDSGLGSP